MWHNIKTSTIYVDFLSTISNSFFLTINKKGDFMGGISNTELIATLTAVTGSFLNASGKYVWSYYVWTVSNIFWIIMAFYNKHWGLLLTQIVFTIANVYGLVRMLYKNKAEQAA